MCLAYRTFSMATLIGTGRSILPAAEMMARGDTALSAFRTYRKAKESDHELAAAARQTLMDNSAYFGYGYISSEEELIPPVGIVFWAFRVMVGLGCFLLLVMALAFPLREKWKPWSGTDGSFGSACCPFLWSTSPARPDGLWPKSEDSRGRSRICCL